LTTEEIDRRIATQVIRQAQTRLSGSKRRGVEQVHSTILQRRQETGTVQDGTEVFEKLASGSSDNRPEVVTIDFLRKYLRYCKIKCKSPILSAEAQQEVADKYVEMRMRFQTGHGDPGQPETDKKPKLAVTTRTLEALIRLATAHAKLKLRADEVTKEDVQEAYKLMLSAREEEVTPAAGRAQTVDMVLPEAPGLRGQKRAREDVSASRLDTLQALTARCFAERQDQEIKMDELLESVNAGLLEGEAPFESEEFHAGLSKLEERNKLMVLAESGIVVLIS